jgi:hypothetical protein
LAALSSFAVIGCEKKENNVTPILNKLEPTITLSEARSWFEKAQNQSVNHLNETNQIQTLLKSSPNWNKGFTEYSLLNREFVSVPVPNINVKRGGLQLLVSRNAEGELVGNYVILVADSAYHRAKSGNYSMSDFTGSILFVDANATFEQGIYLKTGKYGGRIEKPKPNAIQPRNCEQTIVQSTEIEYSGGGFDQVGGYSREVTVYTIYTHCTNVQNIINNNLNNIWGSIGFDFSNSPNPLNSNNGGTGNQGSTTTYESNFIDPNVNYANGFPASLFSQGQSDAQYNNYLNTYMQSGQFSEWEFQDLYWNDTELFKQIDGFLSVSKTSEFWAIAKEHYELSKTNARYRALNDKFGKPKGRLLEFLRRYKNQNKTSNDLINEFEKLMADTRLKGSVDDFLNKDLSDGGRWDAVEEIVENYENTNEYKEDSELYMTLYESSEFAEAVKSLNSFSTSGTGGGSNPMSEIMAELILEGIGEAVGSFIGLEDIKEIKAIVQKGTDKGLKVAFKVFYRGVRLLGKNNPVIKAALTITKTVEVFKKVAESKQLLEKLNNFNPQILSKLFETLKNTGSGKLFGRIKDTNRSSNLAGHWDIDMGSSTVDEFIRKLASAFGKQWKSPGVSPLGQTNMFAQHLDLSSLGIKYFEYYPFSGSTGWASIDIVLNNGKQFKFRLGRL